MKHLFLEWDVLKGRISNLPLLMFFDYDGTLAPIAASPEKAVLDSRTRELIGLIAQVRSCKLAVVSGRSLEDVKERVGVHNIVYVGNHGLQIEGPKLRHTINVGDGYLNLLGDLKSALQYVSVSYPGALIEDKGLSLSVHFRLVKAEHIMEMRTRVRGLLMPYTVKNQIKVKPGKMVIEVRPPVPWDKGRVVLWLLARWQAFAGFEKSLPMYTGDDVTDEDAFRALGSKGLTIAVGNHDASAANYYLSSPAEVAEFLSRIADLKGKLR